MKTQTMFTEPAVEPVEPEWVNADAEFIIRATYAIRKLAAIGKPFTEADIWKRLGREGKTEELAPLLWRAERRGLIRTTGPGAWNAYSNGADQWPSYESEPRPSEP